MLKLALFVARMATALSIRGPIKIPPRALIAGGRNSDQAKAESLSALSGTHHATARCPVRAIVLPAAATDHSIVRCLRIRIRGFVSVRAKGGHVSTRMPALRGST